MKKQHNNSPCNDKIKRNVIFHSDVKLSGTLTLPGNDTKPKPAIVMVAGSGSIDRDGNVKQFRSDLMLKLSDLLTKNGFITLCYDKRGIGESSGSYLESGLTEFIADAVSAVRYIKTVKEVDSERIIVLGHSEGAFIAPAVCSEEMPNGLILLCGTATPTKELLPLQCMRLINEIKKTKGIKGFLFKLLCLDRLVQWQWDKVNHKVLSSNDRVIKLFGIKKFNAKWLRDCYAYNVREFLPNITCPALIIGGEKDIQCIPDEAKDIANLIPGTCTYKIIPNMNHILCHYDEDHHLLSIMKEYHQSLNNGFSSELVNVLSDWLKQWVR